jgi:type I restriction enzyme S subunit
MIDGLKAYPAYRESGLPWVDKLPAYWTTLRSKYLFREVDTRSATGEELRLSMSQIHGLIPSSQIEEKRLVSVSNVGGKICEPNDLVLNRLKAHLGVMAIAPQRGLVSPDYSVFRAIRPLTHRYFCSIYRSPYCGEELRRRAKGIVEGFWRLYTDDFYDIRVPVPPPDEQAAIVRFLDHANGKIERAIRAKRKLIALLNEQKQATIHRAVTRGLDPNVKLKPSGIPWLGDLPEGYKRTRLGRLCVSIRDGTHNPPIAVPGIHRLLSVRNIIGGRFVTRPDDRTMTPAAFRELQRSYTVEAGDVVIALVGATTGKSAVVEPMENVTVQRSLGILRPRLGEVTGEFLRLVITSEVVQGQIRRIMDKYAAQPGIYLAELAGLQILYPPRDEQQTILRRLEEELRPANVAISRAEREIELLREYRTTLTADVVTGKLDVREVVKGLPVTSEELPPAEDEAEVIEDAGDLPEAEE